MRGRSRLHGPIGRGTLVLFACSLAHSCSNETSATAAQAPVAAQAQGRPGAAPTTTESLVANPPKNLESKYSKLDAAADGWDTEVFNDRAGKQLKEISQRLERPGALDDADLSAILESSFRCVPLRPPELQVTFDGAGLKVRAPKDLSDDAVHRGAKGLLAALRELRAPFDAGATLSTELMKTVSVSPGTDTVESSILYRMRGAAQGGVLQQDAIWRCEWQPPRDTLPPLLRSIRIERYEESQSVSGPLFGECTEAVLGGNRSYAQNLLPHLENWLGQLPAAFYGNYYGHQGLAIGDVNGDDLEDVYFCRPGGIPNLLYLHRPDGTAVDFSAEARVDFLEPSRSALLLDLDGDRDQDLFIQIGSGLVSLLNDGAAHFTPQWSMTLPQVQSLAAVDYDVDGDLDVYACAYKTPDADGAAPIPYHDATNGNPNALLRNDGKGSFDDVTAQVGLDQNNNRFSFAASWEDYDNDGDLDVFVANDFGRDNLYRNDGGKFADVAAEAGVDDISAGMSASWGDYDNDGWMDLYIGNMYSGAGNRIATQERFQAENDETTRAQYQQHARGNTLLHNSGDGTFRDMSYAANVTMALWAWSSPFVELNNDGLLDLVVANGFITSEDSKDL